MQEFAIFDFDGTISNLTVDWDLVRKELSISRISDIWSLPENEKSQALDYISKHECMGLNDQLNFHLDKFNNFSLFSVLTNNSERVVSNFFTALNLNESSLPITPALIVGRETLSAPKEEENVFRNGINQIFCAMQVTSAQDCTYVGDQDYELTFARKFGLEATHIKDFKVA